MKNLLVLKSSQSNAICYDIHFKHYNADDNVH